MKTVDVWLAVFLESGEMKITIDDPKLGIRHYWEPIPVDRKSFIFGQLQMEVGGVSLPPELFAALEKEISLYDLGQRSQ